MKNISKSRLIMVVDDEAVVRDVMCAFFESKGHETVALSDGRSAISYAEKNKPDVIFLDIKMPGLDGIETCKVFPISGSSLRQAFDKTVAKAEIKDFHFHDLRHTFATRLVQNGVDLYKIKELLGHKTITMTMRYSHHYPESLRSSVEVLDNCYNFATLVYNKSAQNAENP